MSLPEYGSPEYYQAQERVHRRILDTLSNVAITRKNLPNRVLVIIKDNETLERFGSISYVNYLEGKETAKITRTTIALVPPGVKMVDFVEGLASTSAMPLVCDLQIGIELLGETTQLVGDCHYQFRGETGALLDIYTPQLSFNIDARDLPPEAVSGQQFIDRSNN